MPRQPDTPNTTPIVLGALALALLVAAWLIQTVVDLLSGGGILIVAAIAILALVARLNGAASPSDDAARS